MSDTLPNTDKPREIVRAADDEARAEALGLLKTGHAALAWTDPDTGAPGISRITFAIDPVEGPLTLISELAPHTRALRESPSCAMMVGEVGPKGDPMTHARLMVRARAEFLAPDAPGRAELRARWLERNPKATIYIDLPDFHFVKIIPQTALLNGGFARAFRLSSDDLLAMMKV